MKDKLFFEPKIDQKFKAALKDKVILSYENSNRRTALLRWLFPLSLGLVFAAIIFFANNENKPLNNQLANNEKQVEIINEEKEEEKNEVNLIENDLVNLETELNSDEDISLAINFSDL